MATRNAEQELRQFKQDFQQATHKKDRAALEQMLHDDFTMISPGGTTLSKQELIDDICHPDSDFGRDSQKSPRKTTVSIQGNMAHETADVQMKGKVGPLGDVTGTYVDTSTYIRGPQGWQFLSNSIHKK